MGSYTYGGVTYTSSVPVPYVDAAGFHMPEFSDVLAAKVADYRGIYGQDVNLDNDTQDGQKLGIDAAALMDAYGALLAVYQSFSPATAQGVGLSMVVKINGLRRQLESRSSVDLTIVGQAGTVILGGLVNDSAGNGWALPPQVTVPFEGVTVVTATCTTPGAVTAPPDDVTSIQTVTKGWQQAYNVSQPAVGQPVEADAGLRRRQSKATTVGAQNPIEAAVALLEAVPGVVRVAAYDNDSNQLDDNSQPGHTVCFVVDGGDDVAVATAIALKKIPGTGPFGTTYATVTDKAGIPHDVRWFRPIEPVVDVLISVKPRAGYTPDVAAAIQAAVADYVNSLDIGQDVSLGAIYGPALLAGTVYSKFFTIQSTALSRDGAVPTPSDVSIAFNEAAFTEASRIVVEPLT